MTDEWRKITTDEIDLAALAKAGLRKNYGTQPAPRRRKQDSTSEDSGAGHGSTSDAVTLGRDSGTPASCRSAAPLSEARPGKSVS
jgi:hypothetical protein